MELYQLEYLVAINEYKTLLKTSEMLNVSQPSITKAIKKLEDELGFQLFDRVKNRLVMNELGIEAVKHAKKVLKEVKLLESSTKSLYELKKGIRIASNAPAPLWGLKSLFNVPVEEELIDDNEIILTGLENHEYNIIIIDYPFNHPNYICRKICDEQLHIAVKYDHVLASRNEVSFSDIDGYNILQLKRVGYWYELSKRNLPMSKLLLQDNYEEYAILSQASDLPLFRTNLSIPSYLGKEKRIYLPITDPEATLSFYAVYEKKDQNRFDPILDNVSNIQWANINHQDNDST